MKKIFLAIILVVGMTTMAQDKQTEAPKREKLTSEQRVEILVKKMRYDLDLNDKQTAEIKKITEVRIQKTETKKAEFQAKREEEKKIREEIKNQILNAEADEKAEMKKILTPVQYQKWDKIQFERKEKMKARLNQKMEDGKPKSEELKSN